MSITIIIAAFAMQAGAAAACPNGKATCDPWERQWGATKPVAGDIVTREGRLTPVTTLAGLRLGQSLADAQRIYGSQGGRMVKVNMVFEEPYAIYNLVSESQKIIGNVSFCRNALTSVIVQLSSPADYFQAMKRFVQTQGQPIISFEMTGSSDDSTQYESMSAAWPSSPLRVSYPITSDGGFGMIALSNNQPCR